VICVDCKKEHDASADTFVTVYGNITVGENGGVVGDNFAFLPGEPSKKDTENPTRLDRVTVFCRECFAEMASKLAENVGERIKQKVEDDFCPPDYWDRRPRPFIVHVNGVDVWCTNYKVDCMPYDAKHRVVIEAPSPWGDFRKVKGSSVCVVINQWYFSYRISGTLTDVSAQRLVIE